MFRTSRVLRFGDCDPSGIAYFPSYLDILVGVVEELFHAAGTPWSRLLAERNIGTPTVTLNLTFVRPGKFGALLDFSVAVTRLGNSSMDLEHEIFSGGELLWKASQRIVATSLDTHRSCPWPDDVRTSFLTFLEKDNAHSTAAGWLGEADRVRKRN